jgi:hypothetical protein
MDIMYMTFISNLAFKAVAVCLYLNMKMKNLLKSEENQR